jgi:hypothetical protein
MQQVLSHVYESVTSVSAIIATQNDKLPRDNGSELLLCQIESEAESQGIQLTITSAKVLMHPKHQS